MHTKKECREVFSDTFDRLTLVRDERVLQCTKQCPFVSIICRRRLNFIPAIVFGCGVVTTSTTINARHSVVARWVLEYDANIPRMFRIRHERKAGHVEIVVGSD